MTISKLAIGTWPLAKTSSGANRFYQRPTNPRGFIVHHAAGTSDAGLKSQYVANHRVLSSNYAMTQNGDIYAVLHEEYRPFTSSSSKADNWGITIEIVNSTGAPTWRISDRAFDQLARLIADCSKRWGFPINRSTVIGHREVIGRFGQGVATACPGPYLWSRMDELVALANSYRSGSPAPAPKPSPAPAPTPSNSKVVLGSLLRLSNWTTYTDASLKRYLILNKKRVILNGTYEVIGLFGGNFRLDAGLGDWNPWVSGKAEAGLVASQAPPAPKPAPAQPKAVGLGSFLKLSRYTAYTDPSLRSYLYINKRRYYVNGTYKVIGISKGNFRLDVGLGSLNPWVHSSAKAGLQ